MRTKKQIVNEYRTFLESKNKDMSIFSDEEIFTMLIESLYHTEEVNGKKVSSKLAWFNFTNFVIGEYVGTSERIFNSFVMELFECVEHHNLTAIMASRGLGKSTILFVLYPIFKMFLYEGTDVLLCANIPRTAVRNFRKFKRFIENNEVLKAKLDKDKDFTKKWGEGEAEYNGGFVETISVGSSSRGAHVPLIILDDALRDDNKVSPRLVREFVLGQLYPAVAGTNGRLVVSGTPIDEKDILHEIMNEKEDFQGKLIDDGRVSAKGFYCKVFPAIKNYSTKEVMLPERYNFEKLMMIRKTVGEIRFAREYLCQCLTDETSIFNESLIRKCIDNRLSWLTRGEAGKTYVVGVDLASSASKRADFTSFVVLEYDPENKTKIVREVINAKMTAEEQVNELISLVSKFNNAFVYIEKNNMGEFLRQKLIEENVNVEGFTTNRATKQNFISFLRTELANKRIFFPPLEEQYEIVKTQLLSFGYKERRGVAVMEALSGHDDIVSALLAANMATQFFERDESSVVLIGHN